MERSFKAGAIAGRVVLSTLIGVQTAAVLHILLTLGFEEYSRTGAAVWPHVENLWPNFLVVLGGASATMFLGVIVSIPFCFIAIVVAMLFRNSIRRRLVVWCCVAVLVEWILMCVAGFIPLDIHVFKDLFILLIALDFMLGTIVASLFFFLLSRPRP